MSYPGYPAYPPQAPGQAAPYPTPVQQTAPLSYPIYPGAAAPQPSGFNLPGYPSAPPSYPSAQSVPYPSAGSPYPSAGAPYPSAGSPYPSAGAPYPSTGAPYPSAGAPYPSAGGPYPGANPTSASPYPGTNPTSTSPYPSATPGSTTHYPSSSPYPAPGLGGQYPSYPGTGAPYSYTSGSAPAPKSHQPSPSPHPAPGTCGINYQGRQNPDGGRATSAQAHSQPYHTPSHSASRAPTPTIRPANPFNARADAEVLRKAMKGFGTDEKAIIEVLTNRTNNQRQQIAIEFKTLYGKDLVSDLKSETTGKFEELLVALMTPIPDLLAKELKHAIDGVGTKEETVVEIICTANNYEMKCIKAAYEKLYGSSLEQDLAGDTSGNFRRLLIALCQANRSENYGYDQNAIFQDAQALMRAGELRLGTDESTFNAILCSRSYNHLAAVFMEYQRLTGSDFESAVKSEFSGDIEAGLCAIVRSVRDKSDFFAEQLYKSMAGFGTHDRALIRIVCSRSEIDLGDIKIAYQRKYGKMLSEAIQDDTSGDYKKALLSIIA